MMRSSKSLGQNYNWIHQLIMLLVKKFKWGVERNLQSEVGLLPQAPRF